MALANLALQVVAPVVTWSNAYRRRGAIADVVGTDVMEDDPPLVVTWTWTLVGDGSGFLEWHFR